MDKIRKQSFGEDNKIKMVDRINTYFSVRKVNKILKLDKSMSVLDIGCGYRAKFLKGLSEKVGNAAGVDINVDSSLDKIPNIKIFRQPVETAIKSISSNEFDVITMIAVLEHLNEPLIVINECRRVLKNNGVLIINVPTWYAKGPLELMAFKLNISPKVEMDDHKMYYNKRDIWPILVKAGFKPSSIRMNYHKFGMNLFCVLTKIEE